MNTDLPVNKYRFTLVITANSHEEIEKELTMLTNGGYLLDSDYYKRDEFMCYSGTHTSKLEHVNPEMTPERYNVALQEWWEKTKEARSGTID